MLLIYILIYGILAFLKNSMELSLKLAFLISST